MEKKCLFLKIGLLSLMLMATGYSQRGATIKPYYGFFIPRMNDVNGKIQNDIRMFRDIFGEQIPSPGNINGNRVFGGQIEYHLNENYFLNINFSYYQEEVSMLYLSRIETGAFLNYSRAVELYDVIANLLYYFNYNSWRRFNTYVGIGVGLIVANAHSVTQTTYIALPLNSRGDFSGNSLSGVLSFGGNYRLAKFLYLWGEGGLLYGSMGQLDGSVTTLDNPERHNAVTTSSFDFTGIFVRAGLGIAVPFIR